MTLNANPHIGRINPHVYFAHGYSGHGVALTGLPTYYRGSDTGNDERLRIFEMPKVPSIYGEMDKKSGNCIGTQYYRFLDKFC